ncbi:hypothetical protein AVEN_202871-1 [Araneus ventricosus]|uniref:Uncharacterized protein n=1 Tax=Araneus ventricosus TaxID=182803 RepID=A0A4Y2FLC6_ARAVE|nr:hypothetical protein AVEN_202871-1 [Araneus ventricosus]
MMMIREPQQMIMHQPNKMMTIQKPEKMMMQEPNEMRKQEMEELQEMAKATQIPKAVDILREMDLLRAKTTKIPRQEAAAMEKQKEMERRRQQIADKISETVYQQMLNLLGHLTGEAATQTEMKVPQ